ncbi:MAG: repeat containing protein, partial [Bryobacterales bacterium]|nr:repeat containing protein [Bryobacterales bacterium]
TGDGGPATSAGLGFPAGVAADSSGNVYVADTVSKRVRKVTASTGNIATYAGGGVPGSIAEGGAATSAGFTFPANSHIGLAVDANGNLYVADSGTNRVRKVSTAGVITTVAGSGGLGNPRFSGDGELATSAKLQAPTGVALDSRGNIYIADTGNGRVRKVDTSGVITTIVGRGNGPALGDGGPALNAQLNNPTDVAVDSQGNIYVADFGNNAIRKVDNNGVINTILRGGFGVCNTTPVPAAGADIGRAVGIAIDASDNLYIANESADCVLMAEPNGTVSTVAGGGGKTPPDNIPATTALLGNIWSVNVDPAGNVYLTNSLGYVHKVTPRATPPSALPVITGVVNGASFQAGIAPNSWVTIRGTNLSSQTDLWDKAIIAGLLPTTLDNIAVTIGGRPVYAQYISPTQINVLTPFDLATGVLPVTITTPAGASAAFSVLSSTYMPAFFMWPNNQPVATHSDFSWAAKAGTFAGAATIPAKPGEVIVLWGTGMGPTSPAAPIGVQVSGGPYSTLSLPTITVLATKATVYGAALAPGYAGLYQLAFQVPADFPDGDYPINGAVGSAPFAGAATITVKK